MPPKCKDYHNAIKSRSYHRLHDTWDGRIKHLVTDAKSRAKKRGLDFDLVAEKMAIPERCPLTEEPLRLEGRKEAWNPSLDRIDPAKGYTMDNVWVISWRANKLKNNGTLDEFETITRNWRRAVDERTKRVQGANDPRFDLDPGAEPVVQRNRAGGNRRSVNRSPDTDGGAGVG